jgi:hypothetical protein
MRRPRLLGPCGSDNAWDALDRVIGRSLARRQPDVDVRADVRRVRLRASGLLAEIRDRTYERSRARRGSRSRRAASRAPGLGPRWFSYGSGAICQADDSQRVHLVAPQMGSCWDRTAIVHRSSRDWWLEIRQSPMSKAPKLTQSDLLAVARSMRFATNLAEPIDLVRRRPRVAALALSRVVTPCRQTTVRSRGNRASRTSDARAGQRAS